jgi:hypothetical protein
MTETGFGIALWLWLLVMPLVLVVLDNARNSSRSSRV